MNIQNDNTESDGNEAEEYYANHWEAIERRVGGYYDDDDYDDDYDIYEREYEYDDEPLEDGYPWPKMDNSWLARIKRVLRTIKIWFMEKTGQFDDIPF